MDLSDDYWRIGYLVCLPLDQQLRTLADFADLVLTAAPGFRKQPGYHLASVQDENEAYAAHALEQDLDLGLTTRFLASAILMAGWAAYESAMTGYAAYAGW